MKFNLEIKTPCSEDINNFSPTQKGGFCNSCQKEVIDFSAMSSEEIIQFFKENKNNKTCGMFSENQLEQTYSSFHYKRKTNFFTGIGLTFLSLFSSNIQAQKEKEKIEISPQKEKENNFNQNGIIVSGNVSDEIGSLPGVTILLKGSTIEAETNFDGYFKFSKPLQKGDVLIFSFVGMKTIEVTILNENSVKNIVLKEDNILEKVIITGEITTKKVFKSKKGFWEK